MSAIPSVSSSATIPTALSAAGSTRVPTQTLGQNEFLKLLVTKMQSQDPMNPQADTDFIAQMAQFSSLENSKSMQSDIQALTAGGMLGRNVTVKGEDSDTSGVVTAVAIRDGAAKIEVNGAEYDLDQITNISTADLGQTVNPLINPSLLSPNQAAA